MLKKILIGFCIFFLVLLIGGYIFMRSSFFTGRVRLMMESVLEKRLERDVSVGKLTGNIFGNIKISGISIAKGRTPDAGKFVDIEEVRAGYSLLSLLRWRFVIKSVRITRPQIWLERDEEGKLNIPELAPPGGEEKPAKGKKSRFSVLVSNVDMLFGKVMFDDKQTSISSVASGINGKLRGTGGEMDYSGEFRMQSVDVNVRGVVKTISDIKVSFETSELGATLSDLQFRLGRSQFQATAEVLNGKPATVTGEVKSRLSLEDVSGFLTTPGSQTPPPRLDGIAEIYGVISGEIPNIGGAFIVSVPVMRVNDLEIRNVDAEARFTPDTINLAYLSANLTNGGAKLSGTVQLDQDKEGKTAIGKFGAVLKLENLEVGRIMAGLSGSDAPVSGKLSGEVSIDGAYPRPGNVNVDGRVAVVDTQWKGAESAVVPIGTVEAALSVKEESIALDVFRGKTKAELRGKLSNDGRLNLLAEANMPDLGELTSLLTDSSDRFSSRIIGAGKIKAEASMEIANPGFRTSMGLPPIDSHSGAIKGVAGLRGRVNLDMPDLSLALSKGRPVDDREGVRIGSLTGVIHLVDDRISVDEIILQLGESEFRVAAQIQLKEDARHGIDAVLTLDSLRVENYVPLIVKTAEGTPLRIAGGLLNGRLDVHGDVKNVSGGGEISVTDLLLGHRDIESISVPIEIASNVLSIPNLVISSLNERITAACRLTPSGDYSLNIDSSLIKLSGLLPDAASIGGTAQISISGSGNTDSPSLKGRLDLKDLKYEGEDFGNGGLDFTLKDEKAHVDISLSNQTLIATLDGSMKHPFPFSAIIQLGNINLEPVLNLSGLGEKVDLRVAGSIDVDGEVAAPMNSSMDAVFQTVLLDIQGSRWRNDRNIGFEFNHGKLQVSSLKMKGAGGEFSVDGGFDTAGAIDLRATVRNFDLAIIPEMLELPKPISGRLDCKLSMGGEVRSPSLEMELGASGIAYDQLDVGDASAVISYKTGIAEISRSTLRAFGGKTSISAVMPIGLDPANPPTLDVLAAAPIHALLDIEGIDLSFIPSVAPEILEAAGVLDDVRLEMTGSLKQPKIDGSLNLKDARFQLKYLPVPVEDVNGSLSLTSREGNETSGPLDRGSEKREYGVSMRFGWKMEEGRYDARISVTDAGGRTLSIWHRILGVESQVTGLPLSSIVQPKFQFDLDVQNGQLGGFLKAIPASDRSSFVVPPVDGSFSGKVRVNGEIGDWVSEPMNLLTVINLPLSGNLEIESLNLAVADHKVKSRGKTQISLGGGSLEVSDLQLLTMPPSVDTAVSGPPQIGIAAVSARIGGDAEFEIVASGENLHPGLFSSLAGSPGFEGSPISGRLDFDLKANGKLSSPSIAFSLAARDLALPVHPNSGKTEIDRIRCRVSYKDEILTVEELHLDSFDNQLDIDGTIPVSLALMPVAVAPLDQEMDVKLVMPNFDLSFLSYFSDRVKDVKGLAAADLRMFGTLKAPLLAGSFKLSGAGCQLIFPELALAQAGEHTDDRASLLQPLDIENVDMLVSIENGDLVTGTASLQVGKGQYKAHGTVKVEQGLKPGLFDLSFGASPARIDPFISLASPGAASSVSGEIVVDGQLRGDVRDFQSKSPLDILRVISGEVQIPPRGIKIDAADHRVTITNPKQIYAELQDGKLNMDSFRLVDETAEGDRASSIAAFGSWEIDGENSFDATLNLDMSLLSKLLNKEGYMSGWLAFKLEARGKEVQCFWPPPGISNSFTVGNAVIGGFEGRLTYRDQELRVEQVRISSDRNQAAFSGNIPMNGRSMDLRFDARLDDMGILSYINKDITESSGRGVISASIAGDMRKVIAKEEPVQFAGSCNFSDLNVNFYESNMNFEDVRANVEFDFGRTESTSGFIRIRDFRGKMNGGQFALNTARSPRPGMEIVWKKDTGYRMGELSSIPVTMVDCSLYQPMVYSIFFWGELTLRGRFDAPVVTGDITIREGKYTESLDGLIQRLFSTREIGFKAFLDYPLVQDLELDVNVQVPGDMVMTNSLVDAEAQAFARVSGSLAEPIVVAQGRVVRGKFTYFGREFTITEGEIINKSRIDPEYKIKAETSITSTEDMNIDMEQGSTLNVQMELDGSLSRPLPPDFVVSGGGVIQEQQNISRTDIISILTLGATPSAFLDRGLSGSSPLLMESAKWYLEKRAEKLLDLKEFQIQINPNDSEENRLVMAKEIMKQLSLLMDISYGGQQWIGLQRDMGKHFAFDGKVSQYGDWSFDLKLKHDFP